MMVAVSGTRGPDEWPPIGEVLEVDGDEGAQLCSAGLAVPVVEDKTETAVPPQPEKRGPGRPRKETAS
jgi:hypothetical protein